MSVGSVHLSSRHTLIFWSVKATHWSSLLLGVNFCFSSLVSPPPFPKGIRITKIIESQTTQHAICGIAMACGNDVHHPQDDTLSRLFLRLIMITHIRTNWINNEILFYTVPWNSDCQQYTLHSLTFMT